MEIEGAKEESDEPASSDGYSSQCTDLLFSSEARQELMTIFKLSWPTVLTYLAEESMSVVTILYCGHLGAVPLAAAALALSFTNITGFCVAFGLTSAFDTFCTQAMGAQQKKNVGIVIQRGLWILGVACFLVWAIWLNAEWLLRFMEQENDVARQAGMFCDIMSVGLPGRFIYILLQKYLQTMGVVIPTLVAGLLCNLCHALVSYLLIFTLGYGIRGAAFGVVFSETLYALVLFCYIRWMTPYKTIWPGWRSESLLEWGIFSKMALSGMFMILIDWSTFEAGAFLIGSMDVEELGAFAIINQLSGFLTMVPLGISLSASILVGRALGAGQSRKAIFITKRCIIVGVFCGLVIIVVMIASKDVISYAFTDNSNVAGLASKSLPVFLLFHGFDCVQMVVGGILRGCGQQHYGMFVNFICYNVIGLPLAVVFAAVLKMYNMGFWIGVAVAVVLQFTAYLFLLWRTDWQKLSKQARNRAGIRSCEELAPLSPISSCETTSTSAGSSMSGGKDGIIDCETSSSASSELSSSRTSSTLSTNQKILEKPLNLDTEKTVTSSKTHKTKPAELKIYHRKKNRITAKIKATRLLIVILAVCVWVVGVLVRALFPVPHSSGEMDEFRTSNLTNFDRNMNSSYTGVYSTALRTTAYIPQMFK